MTPLAKAPGDNTSRRAASGDKAALRNLMSNEVAALLRPRLNDIAAEMAREIERCVPEYARARDSPYAEVVRISCEKALYDFVAGVEIGGPEGQPVTEVFRTIGSVEARSDRSLDALQMAMHIGVEVIWRRVSAHCHSLDMGTEKLLRLAEALLVHFRENVRAAADGYVAAQTRLTGAMQRRRRHLLEVLINDPPVSLEAIERVADGARWRLPDLVAVVVLDGHAAAPTIADLDLPPEILFDLSRTEPCIIVPDPDRAGRLKTIDTAVRGSVAVMGPPLPVPEAIKSLRWAREALKLVHRGVIDAPSMVRCTDHMSTLVLFQNEELINTLSAVRLAPLAELRPGQRERLAETLLAWLQTGGDASKVAANLFVHPQTVRYRVRQLQELFGDRLRDPDTRLELEMVLRARRLVAGAHGRKPLSSVNSARLAS